MSSPYAFRSIKHEVERRIVAQLALAHEADQLERDCSVRFVATVNYENKEESKLQMTVKRKGSKKEEVLKDLSEPFSNASPLN